MRDCVSGLPHSKHSKQSLGRRCQLPPFRHCIVLLPVLVARPLVGRVVIHVVISLFVTRRRRGVTRVTTLVVIVRRLAVLAVRRVVTRAVQG
jgi:hypothetical protein